MQITNGVSQGQFPPAQGGNSADIRQAIARQRRLHRRTQLMRSVKFWWYRILIVVLAGLLAGELEPLVTTIWKYVIIVLAALVVLFLAIRRLHFGVFLTVVLATPFFQFALAIKSLNLYPSIPLVIVLFFTAMILVAFRVRKPIFPSFWVMWPLFALLLLAIISNIMVQLTWTHTVPHKVGNELVIYDEVLGVLMFFVPIALIVTACVAVTKREHWIEYMQRGLLVLGLLGAAVVTYEFRRIGADIYTFRYTEPKILWMSLRALATLLALCSMIGYARFLYASSWKWRLIYAGMTVWYLASVYFTLENSWWLEVAVGMLVITVVYSRRLLLTFGLLVLPLAPLIKAELAKLQQVKSVDSLRFVIWQDALRVWSKQPILGVGPGNFWAYDQRFTHLPVLLANFNKTGLGVAHNGYLQTLGEMGPLGLLVQLSLISIIILACFRLYRRSTGKLSTQSSTKGLDKTLAKLGLTLFNENEHRKDAILGLAALGLICGAAVADFTSGFFFLPPRQLGGFNDLPQVLIAWLLWGFVMYKDQVWRKTSAGESLDGYK